MIIIYSLVPAVKIIHSWNLTQITWRKKWNRLKGRHWPLKEESRLCSNLNWYHLTWNGCHPTTFNLLPVLIKQTREPLVVSLVALKQHGNHGCTPRDWPLQRKWKSQRKDKIPWANKEVIIITKFIAQNKLRQDFIPLLGVLGINSMQGREAKDVKLAY